jgi:hypothetical protein
VAAAGRAALRAGRAVRVVAEHAAKLGGVDPDDTALVFGERPAFVTGLTTGSHGKRSWHDRIGTRPPRRSEAGPAPPPRRGSSYLPGPRGGRRRGAPGGLQRGFEQLDRRADLVRAHLRDFVARGGGHDRRRGRDSEVLPCHPDRRQRAGITFPYPTGETKATPADFSDRVGEKFGDSVWSNYPISDLIRPGLNMGDLTELQHTAALAFLSAALSPAGYQKFADITNADQVLADSGTNYAAGTANYVIGIFGTPSETERWMSQLGGHHLRITTTIQGTSMSLPPMLTGCQPSSYTVDGQTIRPLAAETDKAFALINALDAAQSSRRSCRPR